MLNLFQPKPGRFLALISWRRTFFSTHSFTNAKHSDALIEGEIFV